MQWAAAAAARGCRRASEATKQLGRQRRKRCKHLGITRCPVTTTLHSLPPGCVWLHNQQGGPTGGTSAGGVAAPGEQGCVCRRGHCQTTLLTAAPFLLLFPPQTPPPPPQGLFCHPAAAGGGGAHRLPGLGEWGVLQWGQSGGCGWKVEVV
jgi:hypothetical protein